MEKLTHITLVEKPSHKLLPGEATRNNVTYNSDRKDWLVGCPSGNGCIANLMGHSSTYDQANGLLTISPSILCGCGAHYFIEHNQIRWA